MPAHATEQPKAVASGCETMLIDQASMTSSVVSTPSQKSSCCHRLLIHPRSDNVIAIGAPSENVPAEGMPLKERAAWSAAPKCGNPLEASAGLYPFFSTEGGA